MADQKLPKEVRTTGGRVRAVVRTIDEALRLIKDLPPELQKMSRWTFTRDLFVHAAKTGKKRDATTAVRQLKQALSNEGWLSEDAKAEPSKPEEPKATAPSEPPADQTLTVAPPVATPPAEVPPDTAITPGVVTPGVAEA